jgi:ADP-ribose pyrophosphatase YjhB (NUDIX family)
MNWRQRIEPATRRLMQVWWRRRRGMTLGVRGIVLRDDGQVVLVRHTYVGGWHLPGGGVERGEPAEQALQRELAEEAGVEMTGPATLLGVYSNERIFRGDHVLLYAVHDWRACATDHAGEIEAVGWFAPEDLPDTATPATRRRLAEFAGQCEISPVW